MGVVAKLMILPVLVFAINNCWNGIEYNETLPTVFGFILAVVCLLGLMFVKWGYYAWCFTVLCSLLYSFAILIGMVLSDSWPVRGYLGIILYYSPSIVMQAYIILIALMLRDVYVKKDLE